MTIELDYQKSDSSIELTKTQDVLVEVTRDGEFVGITTGHDIVKALENGDL